MLIYIVDDQQAICDTLSAILNDEGYAVETFPEVESFKARLKEQQPNLVFLDIWLPGQDGITTLGEIKKTHQDLPIIMLSGHAGIDSAVKSIKLGASDFIEKPLNLDTVLEKVANLLGEPPTTTEKSSDASAEKTAKKKSAAAVIRASATIQQKTLESSIVINGAGLLTGKKTGISINPLGPDKGILFQTLDEVTIPAQISFLQQATADKEFTANSTVLVNGNRSVRTIEHLMGALAMLGVTNALIKIEEEIPNLDGSALDFCKAIRDAGIKEQNVPAKEVLIRRKMTIGEVSPETKYLTVEPNDHFEIDVRVHYDQPIGEQRLVFNPDVDNFEADIAPARSFNTFENIDMAQKLGKVGSGYLDSHIILHEGKVINTELRYKDEFVRHKMLDLLGDMALLGYPIRGKITANMPSHGLNHQLVQRIYSEL